MEKLEKSKIEEKIDLNFKEYFFKKILFIILFSFILTFLFSFPLIQIPLMFLILYICFIFWIDLDLLLKGHIEYLFIFFHINTFKGNLIIFLLFFLFGLFILLNNFYYKKHKSKLIYFFSFFSFLFLRIIFLLFFDNFTLNKISFEQILFLFNLFLLVFCSLFIKDTFLKKFKDKNLNLLNYLSNLTNEINNIKNENPNIQTIKRSFKYLNLNKFSTNEKLSFLAFILSFNFLALLMFLFSKASFIYASLFIIFNMFVIFIAKISTISKDYQISDKTKFYSKYAIEISYSSIFIIFLYNLIIM